MGDQQPEIHPQINYDPPEHLRPKPGHRQTTAQRQEWRSYRTVYERLRQQGKLGPKDESAVALYETLEENPGDVDIDNLSPDKQTALIYGAGYATGKQIEGRLRRFFQDANQAVQKSLPLDLPVAAVSALSAHNFALRNPDLAARIAFGDEALIIAAGVGYLFYKSIRGSIRGDNESFLKPFTDAFQAEVDAFREDPAQKITQRTLFGAACLGGILALADPKRAGTTVAPILGALGGIEFTQKISRMLTNGILEEAANRQIEGQHVDINDLTFILPQGLKTIKDVTLTAIRNLTDKSLVKRLLSRLSRQGTERDTLPHGAFETILEEITRKPDGHRGGDTPRHSGQHPRGTASR